VTDDTEHLGRTMWFFVVADEDRVRRFPLKRWSRFHRNREPMSEFAGHAMLRMIDVGLVLRDRRPFDVFHTHCGVVPVDHKGRLDEDRYHGQMIEAMSNMSVPGSFDRPALPTSVVDARKRFDDRLLEHRRAQYDAK